MGKKIVVGQTKKKAVITICIDCDMSHIPHFNYIYKNGRAISLNMLYPKAVDDCINMELSDRNDLEEFLNKIVNENEIIKNRKIAKRLSKNKSKIVYENVDVTDVKEDMSYWQLIVKIWNKYNKEQTPKNLLKPYYRNFIEYIDTATFGVMKDLDGAKVYTKMDQERTPHFIYRAITGEEIAISFEKAEYLYPIPRKLTQKELNILVKFLNDSADNEYARKLGAKNNWQQGAWLWNNQNYDGNRWNPKCFPKYLKMDKNAKMPDYNKLND